MLSRDNHVKLFKIRYTVVCQCLLVFFVHSFAILRKTQKRRRALYTLSSAYAGEPAANCISSLTSDFCCVFVFVDCAFELILTELSRLFYFTGFVNHFVTTLLCFRCFFRFGLCTLVNIPCYLSAVLFVSISYFFRRSVSFCDSRIGFFLATRRLSTKFILFLIDKQGIRFCTTRCLLSDNVNRFECLM
ncbi:hypothetical protein PHET_06841 [Paragonimus heterotremus]|uniref:Uncharacterized protein n=1 Tax=Paragonimus heterotremus TaxID=100268 RepID=A0A8J4TBC8_9TREM|nr:hypothetical protein PHET_06841 [Paragonimus heterotremus]